MARQGTGRWWHPAGSGGCSPGSSGILRVISGSLGVAWACGRVPTPPRFPLQAPDGRRCPAPPRLTPAQRRAQVASRQAADRARLSAWTTQPPATLPQGLLFSFGGPEPIPSCRRHWAQCALAMSCTSPKCWTDRVSISPGEQSHGLPVPWGWQRGGLSGGTTLGAAPRQPSRPVRVLLGVPEGPVRRPRCQLGGPGRPLALGMWMALLASPGGGGVGAELLKCSGSWLSRLLRVLAWVLPVHCLQGDLAAFLGGRWRLF